MKSNCACTLYAIISKEKYVGAFYPMSQKVAKLAKWSDRKAPRCFSTGFLRVWKHHYKRHLYFPGQLFVDLFARDFPSVFLAALAALCPPCWYTILDTEWLFWNLEPSNPNQTIQTIPNHDVSQFWQSFQTLDQNFKIL